LLNKNKTEKDDEDVTKQLLSSLDSQFEQRFKRINEEKQRLLKQIEQIHEDLIQGRLNEQKLNSLNSLQHVLDSNSEGTTKKMSTTKLLQLLYDFCVSHERDRLHTVNIYKKLKMHYSSDLKKRSESILNHLKNIETTITKKLVLFKAKYPQERGEMILKKLKTKLQRFKLVRNEANAIIKTLQNGKSNDKIKIKINRFESLDNEDNFNNNFDLNLNNNIDQSKDDDLSEFYNYNDDESDEKFDDKNDLKDDDENDDDYYDEDDLEDESNQEIIDNEIDNEEDSLIKQRFLQNRMVIVEKNFKKSCFFFRLNSF
jgi:hypothetical protein